MVHVPDLDETFGPTGTYHRQDNFHPFSLSHTPPLVRFLAGFYNDTLCVA